VLGWGRVNRRTFSKLLLAAPLLRAQDLTTVKAGGAEIGVNIRGEFDLSREAILHWIDMSAKAVSAYYGKFPVPQAAVTIVEGRRGRGVSNGRSFGEGGAHCRISLGAHSTEADLNKDWMLTHEMVHWGFPSVEDNHHWIEEGSATYIEPIARVKSGWLKPEQVWNDMVRDMSQGLPEQGDEGLDHTHTWGRTYWGGALFCLLADVEITKRTQARKGLMDAIRGINRAGGTIEQDWPIERAFETGDKSTGTTVLMDLYKRMADRPDPVDLAGLWTQLGVRRDQNTAVFDSKAPLAWVRSAICG
jgi:hypothetical protein